MNEEKATIQGVDAVMGRSRLAAATEVHRGMVVRPGSDAEKVLNSWTVGTMFREPSYVSTTADRSVAQNFTRGGRSSNAREVLITIRAPAGTHGVYMNAVLPRKGYADFTKEKELLLHRGTTFRVVSKTVRGRQVHVEMEVVPYAS